VTPGYGVDFQYRYVSGSEAQWNGQIGGSAPEWVMIIRTGSTFSGFASTDGLNWTFVGSASIYMTDPVEVGLAVASHNDGILGNGTFDNVSVNSTQLPPSFSDADIGGPAVVGSAVLDLANGGWIVNGGGSDIWNSSDQFNFASEVFSGDGALVAQVEGLNYTDPWAKAGVMFRDSLDAGSVFADMVVTPGNGVALQWRDQYGNLGNEQVTGLAAPEWVELIRQGDLFSGFYSTDGQNWISVGSPVTLPISTDALAGLAVTAHNNGALNSATFTNVSVTPAGWVDQDIGSPGLPGGATYDGTTWTVLGGGSDIWNGADQFNFVAQNFVGDGAIAAEVDSLTNTDQWAKAGVMFRDSSSPSSAFVDVVATPGNGVALQWRDEYGNLGNDQVTGVTAPVFVKLVRAEGMFTGYYSTDGTNWVEIGSQAVTLNTPSLVGLAVTAHNNSVLNDATFTDVAIASSPVVSNVSFPGPAVLNHPILWVQLTFSVPADLTTIPGSVSLTRNGVPVAVPPGTLYALFVQGSTASYAIAGLKGLEDADGEYVLTVDASAVLDAHDLAPGEGTVSTSWLIDTTPPVSSVNPLPQRESSLDFPVSVQGTDPDGPGGSPPSGLASFDIYVSTNGHSWKFWTNVPASSPTATFHGHANTTYSFYSIAHDLAGNMEVKQPVVEATTYVPLLRPPLIEVVSKGAVRSSGNITVMNNDANLGVSPAGLIQQPLAATRASNVTSGQLLYHVDHAIEVDFGSARPVKQSNSTPASGYFEPDLILAKHTNNRKLGSGLQLD